MHLGETNFFQSLQSFFRGEVLVYTFLKYYFIDNIVNPMTIT